MLNDGLGENKFSYNTLIIVNPTDIRVGVACSKHSFATFVIKIIFNNLPARRLAQMTNRGYKVYRGWMVEKPVVYAKPR